MADTLARDLPELIRTSAEPLPEIDDDRFAAFFDRFADVNLRQLLSSTDVVPVNRGWLGP